MHVCDVCDGDVFISLLIDCENFAGDDDCVVVHDFSCEEFIALIDFSVEAVKTVVVGGNIFAEVEAV